MRRLACAVVLPLALALPAAGAQARDSAARENGAAVSTRDGVYTRVQATRGASVYAGNCRSCHTPESHTGPQFATTWHGRPLAHLYAYIRHSMPKNDPGSLSAQDNVDVLAYLLRLNRMPAGSTELAADSLAMSRIRIDTAIPVRKDP